MGALSDDAVWRLSVAYIGPKSRTERPMKTKIGIEVAYVTRDSDTCTFKVKRSKVKVTRPLYSRRRCVRQLQRWPWESIDRGNFMLRCDLQAWSARRCGALRRPQREERAGALWRPSAYILFLTAWGRLSWLLASFEYRLLYVDGLFDWLFCWLNLIITRNKSIVPWSDNAYRQALMSLYREWC